jgi:hypothetical protein
MKEYVRGLYTDHTNLNIPELKQTCHAMYEIILSNFNDGDQYNGNIGLHESIFQKYNFLMYPFPEIRSLYFEIQKMFYNSLNLYSDPPENHNWFIQCWLNFYFKDDFIDWHNHDWNMNRPEHFPKAWHGFVCVDTEPNSKTSYKWKGVENIIDVESKDGLIVMGISDGDAHRSSAWSFSHPRITIAFDIVPEQNIVSNGPQKLAEALCNDPQNQLVGYKNHWIPI